MKPVMLGNRCAGNFLFKQEVLPRIARRDRHAVIAGVVKTEAQRLLGA